MDIRNRHDLELAYRILYGMVDTIANATGMDKDKADGLVKASNYVIELKRSIRAYQHDTEANKRTLVKDEGMDGYIELFEMPDVSDAEGWFNDVERLEYVPSQYDCTGQAFTIWHKIFRRNGKLMCYHRVGYDF
jgi:hypothetical protein